MNSAVDRIAETFQTLTPAGVETLGDIYAPDARFKDPFNDVRGLAEIQRIFRHMYVNLEDPRFLVTGRIVQGAQCFLTWELHFAFRRIKRGRAQCIVGGSHLVLNDEGRITLHRDYWDAAEELYEKLPVIGNLMKWMRRRSNSQ
ncbi:MAG: nuclear transport factor 2 family protein [Polaromonas sp.]|uniref:nuclear transport factor 2 family protein n=1 Tax=Polaromonas sp. TaxID=1869339 RepID=UPI0032644755